MSHWAFVLIGGLVVAGGLVVGLSVSWMFISAASFSSRALATTDLVSYVLTSISIVAIVLYVQEQMRHSESLAWRAEILRDKLSLTMDVNSTICGEDSLLGKPAAGSSPDCQSLGAVTRLWRVPLINPGSAMPEIPLSTVSEAENIDALKAFNSKAYALNERILSFGTGEIVQANQDSLFTDKFRWWVTAFASLGIGSGLARRVIVRRRAV